MPKWVFVHVGQLSLLFRMPRVYIDIEGLGKTGLIEVRIARRPSKKAQLQAPGRGHQGGAESYARQQERATTRQFWEQGSKVCEKPWGGQFALHYLVNMAKDCSTVPHTNTGIDC